MKRNFIAAALCALCLCATVSAAPTATQAGPQVSEAEAKAVKAVEAAADGAAALKAADDFVKKHPKSTVRAQVARVAASKVAATQDAATRITQAESLLKIFSAPEEAGVVNSVLIDAYSDAGRMEDAFRIATSPALDKLDNPLAAMITLTIYGENEARKQNMKFAPQSRQLGVRAAELIEADKRPATVDDAVWNDYKVTQLPRIYNALAVMSFVGGDAADAKANLAKAVAAKSAEPSTYILLGSIADKEYQETATAHRAATGAAKDELLKKAHQQRDQAIESFAQAIALTEGNAGYDQMRPQLMQALEWHYNNRPGGSPEALKQLIEKYKKPKS